MNPQEVYYKFWGVYEKLRGISDSRVFDSGAIGGYFFVMLFLKYISDGWLEAYEKYKRQYGDDELLIGRKMERERFVLSDTACFDFIATHKNDHAIGEIINKVLLEIGSRNWDKIGGISDQVDFNNENELGPTRERINFLSELVSFFEEVDLRPSNERQSELVQACIDSIDRFAGISGAAAGQFYTPRDICRLIAGLMQPGEGERVYDPTCGNGGMLVAAAQAVKDKDGKPSQDFALYGQEANHQVRARAIMRMYLLGLDNIYIAGGDVISAPAWTAEDSLEKFEVVVSNIPFSTEIWGMENLVRDHYRRFKWGLPPRTKGDYAFIQHALASANTKSGRIGLVVSQGSLFREGKEAMIRKGILMDNLIEAVIALPANLFYSTAIPCSILLLNKAKGKNTAVLFINATEKFESGKFKNKLTDEHIQEIVDTFIAFKQDPIARATADKERFSRVVSLEEVAAMGYNLNVSRYVSPGISGNEETLDVPAIRQEIARLKEDLGDLDEVIKKGLIDLGLEDR